MRRGGGWFLEKQYEILKKPSRKIIIFSPVNEWCAIAFASPHKITMSVMLKIFIYNLLWLAEYQCEGVVKFNMSQFFWGGSVSVSFGLSNKSGFGKSWQIVDFMFTFEDF